MSRTLSPPTPAQFHELADSLPDIVWSAPAHGPCADFMNQRWFELAGETHADPDRWRDLIHPDDRERVAAEWYRCVAAGVRFEAEYRIAPAGTTNYRWYVGRAVPAYAESGAVGRWYGTITDIHAWKQAESLVSAKRHILEMIATGAPLRRTLDAIVDLIEMHWPEGIASIMLVEDGRLFVGSAPRLPAEYVLAISNVPAAEGVGSCGTAAFRGTPVIVPDIEASELWAGYREAARSHGLRACWSVPIVGSSGHVIGTVAVYYRGVREPNHAEAEFATESGASLAAIAIERDRVEREVREQAAALAQADRNKDQFLARLAHEFRNPLGAMQAAIQVLQSRAASDPASGRPLAVLERQSSHLVRLIEDLRDLSVIARGELSLRRQPVDIGATLADAADTVRPVMTARGHRLDVETPPRPMLVTGDPARLLQIFVNVLNNAAKYTPRGGTVSVSAREASSDVSIRVRDSGIGIASDMLERIFELYTRTDNATAHSESGIGIGLHLVHMLVGLHGGTVTATSAGIGQGSEFEIRLPLAAGHG